MPISYQIKKNMERASWIRKMFEEGALLKKKIGPENVFDFSIGNPTMEPPGEFFTELELLTKERKKGAHRYMPNTGFPEVREAIANQLSTDTGLPFDSNCIIMTCGAAGGLNVAIKTIADPGDEIIILAPYFAEYLFYAENYGSKAVVVETGADFSPDIQAIKMGITSKTRAIIVNSPNNPTGKVYGEDFFKDLNNLLLEKELDTGRPIYLLSDDPYHKLVYNCIEAPRAFRFVKNCISVTSHSKDLSIPGERIGYMAINPDCDDFEELVNGAAFSNRTLGFVNAPAMAQRLVMNLQSLSVDIKEYQFKRDMFCNALEEIGYKVKKPEGAFYLFPRSPIPDDVRFVKILQGKRVLTVPGKGFGRPGYFRIAYCVNEEMINASISGFREAFEEVS